MRTLNALLSFAMTAALLGGCSAHAHVGGKVGRRAAAPQHKVDKVAVETHAPTTEPGARN
jgi:hypothetical protein